MVKINGQLVKASGKTIAAYLANTTYHPRHIAIEKNGQIVPRSLYETTYITAGDTIEIVSFVGGG